MAMATRKLRVLCLHGYRQNEAVFRERTGGLRKLLKRELEFVFIAAPHVIPEHDNVSRPPEQQERGWWFSRPEKGYNALDRTDVCIGFEDSVKALQEVVSLLGPFDGLLGFSQGACFATLVCALQQRETNSPFHFQFVILFAGFQSLLPQHTGLYKEPIKCPSFHSIGETDAVIPTQSSLELAATFAGAVSYTHSGGHYIPASPHLRTALREFLLPFLDDS